MKTSSDPEIPKAAAAAGIRAVPRPVAPAAPSPAAPAREDTAAKDGAAARGGGDREGTFERSVSTTRPTTHGSRSISRSTSSRTAS